MGVREVYVWECDYHKILAIDPSMKEGKTRFPNIMNAVEPVENLETQVRNGSFFGFVACDLW